MNVDDELHVLDDKDQFRVLRRLLGEDRQGILSSTTTYRLVALRRIVCAAYRVLYPECYGYLPYVDPRPHPTGQKIVRIGRRFVDRFRLDRLCITLESCANGGPAHNGCYDQEPRLLEDYAKGLGEHPALND